MAINMEASETHREAPTTYESVRDQIQAGIEKTGEGNFPYVEVNGKGVSLGEFLAFDVYKMELSPEDRQKILDEFLPIATAAANRLPKRNERTFGADAARKVTFIPNPISDIPLGTERPLDAQELASGKGQRSYKDEE